MNHSLTKMNRNLTKMNRVLTIDMADLSLKSTKLAQGLLF